MEKVWVYGKSVGFPVGGREWQGGHQKDINIPVEIKKIV